MKIFMVSISIYDKSINKKRIKCDFSSQKIFAIFYLWHFPPVLDLLYSTAIFLTLLCLLFSLSSFLFSNGTHFRLRVPIGWTLFIVVTAFAFVSLPPEGFHHNYSPLPLRLQYCGVECCICVVAGRGWVHRTWRCFFPPNLFYSQ